jgi:hypothetical protein
MKGITNSMNAHLKREGLMLDKSRRDSSLIATPINIGVVSDTSYRGTPKGLNRSLEQKSKSSNKQVERGCPNQHPVFLYRNIKTTYSTSPNLPITKSINKYPRLLKEIFPPVFISDLQGLGPILC